MILRNFVEYLCSSFIHGHQVVNYIVSIWDYKLLYEYMMNDLSFPERLQQPCTLSRN
jgi:hypothetical protein